MYFEGCPNWKITVRRVHAALEATGHAGATVDLIPVTSAAEAAVAGFAGSPTVLVEGQDLFPDATAITQLACPVYPGPEGLSGSPTEAALIAALSDLRTRA